MQIVCSFFGGDIVEPDNSKHVCSLADTAYSPIDTLVCHDARGNSWSDPTSLTAPSDAHPLKRFCQLNLYPLLTLFTQSRKWNLVPPVTSGYKSLTAAQLDLIEVNAKSISTVYTLQSIMKFSLALVIAAAAAPAAFAELQSRQLENAPGKHLFCLCPPP